MLHFLLIGAGLFLLSAWRGGPVPPPAAQPDPQSVKIVVTRADIDLLEETFTRTWRRPPAPKERESLVDNFIRDEIYYREARALGLDRQDSVIRRRMRQQMEFIFEDIASQAEPTENELISFIKENPDRYRIEQQIAFHHIYLGEYAAAPEAGQEARRLLAQLAAGADPATVGVPFLQGQEVPLSPLWDIESLFGEKFTGRLLELTTEKWEGPLRSPYGFHLVRIAEHREGRLPPLAEVRDAVKRDLMTERQEKLKDEAYANLKRKYVVVIEKPQDVAAGSVNQSKARAVN